MMAIDARDLEIRRRRQLNYLSHYGSDGRAYWERKCVWEIEAAHADMSRLIQMENGETPDDD